MSLPKWGINQNDANRGYKSVRLGKHSFPLKEWIPFCPPSLILCNVAHMTVSYCMTSIHILIPVHQRCYHLFATISPESIQASVIVQSKLKQMDLSLQ